jgi:hypothetical protein
MDPSKKQRVGYLTGFEGLNMGEFLKADIEVFTPYSNGEVEYEGVEIDAESAKATVVGILDSFSFGGGVGDPLCVSGYISAENAEILKAKTKGTLDTTMITKLAFWICNFDEENKIWYEECFPKDPAEMRGQLNAPGGKDIRLVVAAEPTKVHPNVDVNVYNIYVEVIPAADDTFAIHFATSSKTKFVRNWGLKVGSNAAAAMGA